MKIPDQTSSRGISIRLIHLAMIVCVVVIAALLVFSTFRSSRVFSTLSQETENYVVRQNAAHDLMEASDYLTEMVQRFTLGGETKFLDNYFEEAFVSKRRETAILVMSDNKADENLIRQLQEAMEESLTLMYREYYAMKLVIEAKGIQDYPDTLKAIELKEEDDFLSADEKMERAQAMVMGSEYYESKETIRTKLRTNLDTLEQMMSQTRQNTTEQMTRDLNNERIIVIVLTVTMIILVGLMAYLITLPLIRAIQCAKRGEKLPLTGAKEIRQLAEIQNEMIDALAPKEEREDQPATKE